MIAPLDPHSVLLMSCSGASDAGDAASTAAAWLRRVWGATLVSGATHGESGGVAGSEARWAGEVALGPRAAAVVLASQSGEASHLRSLPVRVDTLPRISAGSGSGDGPRLHILVTLPRYADAAPSPAGALALVNAAADALGLHAPVPGLLDDAEAWLRGVAHLAQRDPRVGRLSREWAQGSPDASSADLLAEATRAARSAACDGSGRP